MEERTHGVKSSSVQVLIAARCHGRLSAAAVARLRPPFVSDFAISDSRVRIPSTQEFPR